MKGINCSVAFLGFFGLIGLIQAQAPQEKTVRLQGQVLGPAGKPLSGVLLVDAFRLDLQNNPKAWEQIDGVVRTDAEGRFDVDFNYWMLPFGIIAIDQEHQLGATYTLTKENLDEPISLTLKPLRKVMGQVQPKDLALEGRTFSVSFGTPDLETSFVFVSTDGALELYLPPGEYGVFIFSRETQPFRQGLIVPDGADTLQLQPFELQPTKLAQNYGKEPPKIEYTAIRGLPDGTTLSDFKGKWVLLEFWGYW